ncbi:FecR family protein [Pedobacter ginsengisoli]|uniref:FecR family protein n=1 Tax=Pedobacter ginsengisoli TaxID=363852 RepID=UPI00254A7787|nr:FecR family protein [Pedobacter ginsengisoli]
MQQTDELLEAIERYLAGNATAAQRQLVNQWYHSFDDELVTVETVDVAYEELLEARLRLRLAESTGIGVAGKTEVKRVRLWPRIAVAAAAVAAITLGTWIYMNVSPDVKSGDEVAKVNDIAPGKNGATITLGNGRVIQLSDAKNGVVIGSEVSYSDGSDVHDSLTPAELQGADSKGQMLIAATARGQTYQFMLPDGTRVWLNADSKLEFPSSFVNSNTRNVKLIGEGYFEVAKDKAHPFIVGTKNQDVTVLGTHFNISAYQDEHVTTTTLVEGSVRVSSFDVALGRRTETLKPNQQSIQNPNGGMQVRNVDVSEALDWKNGLFIFNDEPLQNVMRRVARWYDVEVSYEGVDQNELYGGSVSRYDNVSNVLRKLELTGGIHFKIEGRKIKVMK